MINAPASGRLIAFASDNEALIIASSAASDGVFPFGATRGFTVEAGTHLLRLCDVPYGAAIINDPSLTAIFVAS